MDEDIVLYVVATVTTLGLGAGALTAWWLWLRSRTGQLAGSAARELAELKQAVHELQTDIASMYTELTAGQAELNERLDFAERMLARGAAPREEPGD